MRIYSDMKEFFKAYDGQIFRFWVYKKMFTPYEQEKKFSDESIYENEHCSYGRIIEVAPLPDGDLLLAFQIDGNYDEGINDIDYVTYYKLSEIQLDWSKNDQTEDVKRPIEERLCELYGIDFNEEDEDHESIDN